MACIRKTRLIDDAAGAALVEYVVLLIVLLIAMPAVLFLGGKVVPSLFDSLTPIETLIPFDPENPLGPLNPGDTIEIVIPDCTMSGDCAPPDEAINYCYLNTPIGEECSIIPYVPVTIDPSYSPPDPTNDVTLITTTTPPSGWFLVPIPVDDPEARWIVEDVDYDPYANTPDSTEKNNSEILGKGILHPGAQICFEKGGLLPALDLLAAMAPHKDMLNLISSPYQSSSQHWGAGGYNPPPVLEDFSYVKTFDFGVYMSGGNPENEAFITHSFPVRCVYR